MSRKPYEGILKEPMRLERRYGGVVQLVERLLALMDHYDLPRSFSDVNMMHLALALSRNHVPGFQFRTPGLLSDTRAATDLIILVDLTKAEEGGKSVNNAARLLAQKHPDWGLKASSIRQRFYRLKKAGPELKRVRKLLSLMG